MGQIEMHRGSLYLSFLTGACQNIFYNDFIIFNYLRLDNCLRAHETPPLRQIEMVLMRIILQTVNDFHVQLEN